MLRQTLRSALSPIPRAVRTLGASPSPAVLFAASEQGAWYDPADFSTLYQDSAGTTPVTAVGQPVGLMLDKRLGAVRGAEQLGAWVPNANWSVAGNALTCTGGSSIANATAAVPAGVFYEVTYTISAVTTAGTGISIGLGGLSTVVRNSVGTFTEVLQASGAGTVVITTRGDALWRGTVTNVSVKPILGNHATQATATSRPLLQQDASGFYYLSFDGTDDGMATGSIDFSATDKMTVIAGVHKASDAAVAILAELSADLPTNNGAFYIAAPVGAAAANYAFSTKGTIVSQSSYTNAAIAAPGAHVVTGQGDIGADVSTLRVNGAQASTNPADQGIGNYGKYPLYIGRRGGSSLPFNGRLYGLIVRGAATDAATLARSERFMAARMGIAL